VKSNLNFSNLDDSFKEFDDYLHFRKNFEDEHNESYLLNFDLLDFWKNNTKFPTLRKLVLRYLSFPASSVTTERLWSVAGLILTKQRNRLSINQLTYLLFLRENNFINLCDFIASTGLYYLISFKKFLNRYIITGLDVTINCRNT